MKNLKRLVSFLALMALVGFGVLGVIHAANQPYAIARGLNGTWAYVSCYNGSNNSTSCTDHWVIGSGSQDPSNAYGNDGDLFWRTDLKAFRTKTAGVWGAASFGSGSLSFPILMPDGSQAAPSLAFSTNPTAGVWLDPAGQDLIYLRGPDQAGTDVIGGDVRVDGGRGTGTGFGGNVTLRVATPAAGSGSSANTYDSALDLSGSTGRFWLGGNDAVLNSASEIEGTRSTGSNERGGDVRMRGGPASSGNANGGDVTLAGGNGIGTGTAGFVKFTTRTFATLGTPANGSVAMCSDCTIANPCASGGTGAFAKRLNAVWVCN